MPLFIHFKFFKMKKITTFLFLFTSILINAQTVTISGKVIDENQQALVGATILVNNVKKGTSTDFKGNFTLKLPKGIHKIQVSYVGFQTKNQEINVDKNQTISIQLSFEENVLDEVLVSAVRVQADAPVTHSNITKKEIAKRNLGQDIPILLNYLPSVTTSSDAGAGIGYTYIRVRGSDASRVNVTVNGIPYNDAESQGTFWVNMGDFASSTQSVQLQRGVGTSTNGAGAFGASLNILTDAVSEEANGEISNSFGSYGTRKHTVKFSTGKLNNHTEPSRSIEFAGRLSKIYSDGYIDRAFSDLKSYFLQGSYTDKNTLIKALAFGGKEHTYQAWFGLDATQLAENRRQNPYTYDNETDNYQQDHYQLHWNEKLNKNWSTNLGLNYTRGKGYFEQFKDGEDAEDYNNLIVDGSDVIVQRWLDNHFYVANFNANYKNDNFNNISGISYSNYTNDHYGEIIWGSDLAANTNIRDRYYVDNSTKTDFNIYTKANYRMNDKWSLFGDLQYRTVGYQANGDETGLIDETFNFFNPKAGVTYDLNQNNNLYLSFAVANREPNRTDYEDGTPRPEKLNDLELGWRHVSSGIQVNTNVYYMDYIDQLVLTGELNDVGGALRANVKDSYRLGLEIDANIRIGDKVDIGPNLAFSANKIQNLTIERDGIIQSLGDTNISFSPNFIAGNRLTFFPWKELQLSLFSKYVSEQYLSNTDTRASKIGSYFTTDLNVTYEITFNKTLKSVVFSGLVNNIFNELYVSNGYTYLDSWSDPGNSFEVQGYYPQAGTNFLLGATIRF